MEGRVRRNRIPNEHRERIVRAFEDPHEDYLLVTDMLGVNRRTARGIVATYVREGRTHERTRGGPNNVKVDDEMKDCLNEIVDKNCSLTLSEINQELRRRLPAKPFVHDRTVRKALDCMLIRIKLARPLSADRNRPDIIQERVEYANWFMTNGILHHCVFIDEFGYDVWTPRRHVRARVDERGYRQVLGQRRRNVIITLAVSPTVGLVHYTGQIGGMNARLFNDFLVQARLQLNPEELVYMIYDGAPAYRNAVNSAANTELKMLPVYSPFLNIVEQAASALKAAIKAEISKPAVQQQLNDREEAGRQGIPLRDHRQNILLRVGRENTSTITVRKCVQWFRIMKTYIPRCLNGEHIEG